MPPVPTRYLTKSFPVMGVVAAAFMFYHFDRVPVTHRFYELFLGTTISLVTVGSVSAVYLYSRRCKRNVFWVSHGFLFLTLTALATVHAVDYWFGQEMLTANQHLIKRVLCLQFLAASVLALPSLYPELSSGAPGQTLATPRDLIVVYVFVALYPVQHYVTNNVDAFTPALILQFAVIAAILPAICFFALFVYVRPLVSGRLYFLSGVGVAIAIHASYMEPLYRDLSTALATAAGVQWEGFSVALPISMVLLFLAYTLRSAIVPFLSMLLLLLLANLGYTQYRQLASSPGSESARPGEDLRLTETPSIYVLVTDGYQNREALRAKGLEHLSAGPTLAARGFHLYDNAHSNYKPSVESLTSFFGVAHHYYRPKPDWEAQMTGDNTLYSIMKSNGYTTVVAHPNNYLLQGSCNSDVCYPAPGSFGQIGFILAETIFYEEQFAGRTQVGRGRYERDFYQILEDAPNRAIVYSHMTFPGHGPRGCIDDRVALERYEDGLQEANQWILNTVDKTESLGRDAIVIVIGDHGAFISGNCTWSDPDVKSQEAISDNLGILMAVKWPSAYRGQYDSDIHTLTDLSWYLLQFLSGDQMNEADKPRSDSYLVRQSEDKMFKVIQDGAVVSNPIAYEVGESEIPQPSGP